MLTLLFTTAISLVFTNIGIASQDSAAMVVPIIRPPTISMKMAPQKPPKAKKKKKKKAPSPTAAGVSPPVRPRPSQPSEEELVALEQARDAHMATVRSAVENAAPKLLEGLDEQGFAVIDDFLPRETVLAMRAECELLREGGRMQVSQSTKWDFETNSLVAYDKRNVLSTNLAVSYACFKKSPHTYPFLAALPHTSPQPAPRVAPTTSSRREW